MVSVHLAGRDELPTAARLLHDFNTEYDEPSPGIAALTARLDELVRDGDTAVLVATEGAGPDESAVPVERTNADEGAAAVTDGPGTTGSVAQALGLAVLRFRKALWSSGLECYLAELYVVPSRRGAGIGTMLLGTCLDHARARGADGIDLTTSEDDVAARHLYERTGFNRTEGRAGGPLSFYYELDLTSHRRG